MKAITECTPTPAGEYSNTIVLNNPIGSSLGSPILPIMTKGDCSAGYYCAASASATTPANSWPTNKTTYCGVGQKCVAKST